MQFCLFNELQGVGTIEQFALLSVLVTPPTACAITSTSWLRSAVAISFVACVAIADTLSGGATTMLEVAFAEQAYESAAYTTQETA